MRNRSWKKNVSETCSAFIYGVFDLQVIVISVKRLNRKASRFPWWLRIVAWILLWAGVLVSFVFVTFYAVQLGDTECRKWMTSMIISFITSIFLTQPIKARKHFKTNTT